MDRIKIVGHNIKEAREKLGLTQDQLAKQSGLGRSYISRIEKGGRDVGLASLFRIADALRRSIDSLLYIPVGHGVSCPAGVQGGSGVCDCGFETARRLSNG
jgi:transcriptional regulator with XRE-family HTH domain